MEVTGWVLFLTKTSGIHANFPTKFLLHFVYNLIHSYMPCRKQPQNTTESKVNLGFAGLKWLLCAEPAHLGIIASVKCELKNNRLMDLYLHRKERPYTGSFIQHLRSYLFIYLFEEHFWSRQKPNKWNQCCLHGKIAVKLLLIISGSCFGQSQTNPTWMNALPVPCEAHGDPLIWSQWTGRSSLSPAMALGAFPPAFPAWQK